MNVSAADSSPTTHPRDWLQRGLTLAMAALLLAACAEEPLPQRRLSVDDCLTRVKLDELPKAIKRCDQVVAAFPNQPQPLNERFLLHSLRGDEQAACRDIRKAEQLARRIPAAQLDRLLRRDLELRVASCREDGSSPQRPAAAKPAG